MVEPETHAVCMPNN